MASMSVLSALLLTVAFVAPVARADCGSVPFYAPMFTKTMEVVEGESGKLVGFDPLAVSVFEPKQRALVLWNGEEQILLLSTDQRATQASAILEVIPLPSKPKVRLGDFDTFEAAQRLVVEKRMWAVAHGGAKAGAIESPKVGGRIEFEKKMGAHNLAVTEVLDGKTFVSFAQDYLKERYETPEAPIRPEFIKIIQSYVDDGYKWFAFDVISLGDKVQSRQPIEYRFKTPNVFYPMRISTLEKGKTEVELLVFTPSGATVYEGFVPKGFQTEPMVNVGLREVEALNKEWQGFFKSASGNLAMDQWKVAGELAVFTKDIKAR